MSPIQTQLVELPWGQGLETKQDPFKIPLGKLVALSNATFNEPGRLQKRNGYAALTQSILGGGSIASPSSLFERMGELLQTAGAAEQSLYSYSANAGAWVSKGLCPSVASTVQASAQPQYSAANIDLAIATNGLQCFVYELLDMNTAFTTSLGSTVRVQHGIGYTVFDPATGQIVVSPSTLDGTVASNSAAVCSPRVLALGNTFVCYYLSGDIAGGSSGDIVGRTLSATTPLSGWSGTTTITSGTTTSNIGPFRYQFEACVIGGNALVAFPNRSTSGTIFKLLAASPLTVNATSPAIGATRPQCVTVFGDPNGNIAYGAIESAASSVTAAVLSSSLGAIVNGPFVLEAGLTSGSAICLVGVATASQALTFFYGTASSSSGLFLAQEIRTNTLTGASYSVGTPARTTKALSIAGKPFVIGGTAYLPTWVSNNVFAFSIRAQSPQSGIYLLDAAGNMVSKGLIGTNGGFDTLGWLQSSTSFVTVPQSSYQVGSVFLSNGAGQSAIATLPASQTNILQRSVTTGDSIIRNYQFGATALSFSFSNILTQYQRAELALAVHTNGGVLQMYDGQQAVEHGFPFFPAFIGTTVSSSGGSIGAGSYQYVFTYEWMDGQGQLHISTPSAPVTITTTGALSSATLTVPTLQVTAKTGVLIQGYRTLANGSIFFQFTNFNGQGSLFNDKTVDTVQWVDTQSDAAIRGNPTLYTTGGVLENTAVNPAGPMTVHRNRIFVVDSNNPTTLWYSQQLSQAIPVQFSDQLTFAVDPKGGPITALASLDDKLIIFKSDRIFMLLGQGPDELGNQNDFTDAILVNADTGCAVPKSIVVTPDGLMYQSPKGIYQLSRALQVSYIGVPVENIGINFSGSPISASLLRPNSNQIYFCVTGGATIIEYDYLVDQWSEFQTSFGFGSLVDSVMFNGLHCILTSTGVKQETAGLYSDPSGDVLKSLTTGWIKLSGLQGFQRARRLWFLGAWRGAPHILGISISYDYNAASSQATSFEVLSDPGPYQFMVHLAQQKCEAIQITVTEQYVSGQPGETADWVGMQLEVGVKKGGKKLGAVSTGG